MIAKENEGAGKVEWGIEVIDGSEGSDLGSEPNKRKRTTRDGKEDPYAGECRSCQIRMR